MRGTRLCLTMAALTAPMMVAEAQQLPSIIERVRGGLGLPAVVDTLKRRGEIPETDIRTVIEEHRRRRIPASEAKDVLQQADAAIRENGPVDNFGAFVKGRLDAGLRGRALAQAIRAEHQRRGIGQGRTRSMGASGDTTKGRSGAARGNPDKGSAAKGSAQKGDAAKAADTKGKGKGRP